MSIETIYQLSEKRKKWVKTTRENDFEDGIKRLLTDLYPDNAHFIYELLQNAEDAKASEVHFILNTDSIEFEHNGSQLFSISDVESITSIGNSPKKDDPTSIGKFGVGFKAVFAYTSTPEIKSGEYHFRIRDLVVPETKRLSPRTLDENRTHFFFPFNNPQKPAEKACAEIEKSLRQLNEGALLFLKNIRKIEYRLPDSRSGSLERMEKDGDQIEISVRRPKSLAPASVHYLRFEKVVEVWDEDEGKRKPCRIAVAFGMERGKAQKWKIKQLDKGQVCIYFPAENEPSNLRFHLHAPFASTVARNSIRDCPANDELRDHLADLVAESMFAIRDQGLLDVAFLAVLPNDEDNRSSFNQPIQEKLVEVFNNEKLIPMKQGGHAPATDVFRGSAQLSSLIDDKDLARILGKKHSPPLWIANPRNPRSGHFLSMLEIKKWTTQDLIDKLSEESEMIMKWLARKNYDWHRRLYILLLDELNELNKSLERTYWYEDSVKQKRKDKLLNLCIIRCSDEKYRKGKDCFFPSTGVKDDKEFPCVAKRLYSSDKDDNQQYRVREFFKIMGVHKVEERDRVKKILRKRYTDSTNDENVTQYVQDLKQFIRLVKDDSEQTNLFSTYHIFQSKDKIWRKPNEVFLDSPYLDTGLSAYYEAIGDDAQSWEVSEEYEKCGISAKKIGEFAKAVGARTKLCVKNQVIQWSHPEVDKLKIDAVLWPPSKKNITEKGVDEDYYIQEFDVLLNEPNLKKSQLIWNTMNRLPAYYLKARYRPNSRYSIRQANSILVWRLKEEEWVPQEQDDEDKFSFVKPSDAIIGLLPKGFQVNTGTEWLEAIELGKWEKQERIKKEREAEAEQRKQERAYQEKEKAAEIFKLSVEQLEELARLNKKDPGAIQEFLQQQKEKRQMPSFPERTSNNPDRREERIKEQIADAPDKEYKQRQRSVRTTEIDRRTYLKNQYINDDDQMICQICQEAMPFKKRDGEYYFETKEALSRDYFTKEHEAQYLALCPECAARYTEFVKNDEDAMKKVYNALKNPDEPEISLQLGELTKSLRFVETHRQDIRTILQNERDK